MDDDDTENWNESDPTWEEHAERAIKRAWENCEFDEVRGVIEVPDRDDPRHRSRECSSIEDLHSVLAEIYTNEWYGYVPFDSGETVSEDDADGFVSDFLSDKEDIEQFFSSLEVEDTEEDLFSSKESVGREESQVVRLDLQQINDELIFRLAQKPELMRELDPRKFEELIADLLRDRGYDVTLTKPTNDGGCDIIAIRRDDIGQALTLVECKRYAEHRRVGVEIVRGLYGVVSTETATQGLVATTSYFTKGAKAFRDKVPFRLSLADFDVLKMMFSKFKQHRRE